MGVGGREYELGGFVLLDWERCGSMGSHAPSAKSGSRFVSLVPPTYPGLNLCLPSLSAPFPVLLFPRREESNPAFPSEDPPRTRSSVVIRTPQRRLPPSPPRHPPAAMAPRSAEPSRL